MAPDSLSLQPSGLTTTSRPAAGLLAAWRSPGSALEALARCVQPPWLTASPMCAHAHTGTHANAGVHTHALAGKHTHAHMGAHTCTLILALWLQVGLASRKTRGARGAWREKGAGLFVCPPALPAGQLRGTVTLTRPPCAPAAASSRSSLWAPGKGPSVPVTPEGSPSHGGPTGAHWAPAHRVGEDSTPKTRLPAAGPALTLTRPRAVGGHHPRTEAT